MSEFGERFIQYSNYINENGSEKAYIDTCEKYRREYLDALIFAEPEELTELIHNHQFAVHMEDGFALYQRYFVAGEKNRNVLSDFCEFLWFWGDYDDELTRMRKYIESGRLYAAEQLARELCNKGIGGNRIRV